MCPKIKQLTETNPNRNWVLWGQFFSSTWFGSAWSWLVLIRNQPKKQFPEIRNACYWCPVHRDSSSIQFVPFFGTPCSSYNNFFLVFSLFQLKTLLSQSGRGWGSTKWTRNNSSPWFMFENKTKNMFLTRRGSSILEPRLQYNGACSPIYWRPQMLLMANLCRKLWLIENPFLSWTSPQVR